MQEKIKMPHKPKILIFEDSPFVAEIYLNKFREAGFEVKTYAFPPDNLVEEVIKEKPDIISMNIIMPNIDGYQATEMLKADSRAKDIPIIGFTNFGLKENIEKGIEVGMTDYFIAARWTPAEYVEIIKDYLENPQKYQKKYPAEIMVTSLERDEKRYLLLTLRNKDIINTISEEYGRDRDKITKAIGEALYLEYTKVLLFDPRQENVVFRTKEEAVEASKRAALIDALDEKYLAEKNKNRIKIKSLPLSMKINIKKQFEELNKVRF